MYLYRQDRQADRDTLFHECGSSGASGHGHCTLHGTSSRSVITTPVKDLTAPELGKRNTLLRLARLRLRHHVIFVYDCKWDAMVKEDPVAECATKQEQWGGMNVVRQNFTQESQIQCVCVRGAVKRFFSVQLYVHRSHIQYLKQLRREF